MAAKRRAAKPKPKPRAKPKPKPRSSKAKAKPKPRSTQTKSIRDPMLGVLRFAPRLGWFEGKTTLYKKSVRLRVGAEAAEDLAPLLLQATRVVGKLAELDAAARERAARLLRKLKNEVWLEGGEPPISSLTFKARMALKSVTVESDGSVLFYYADGDLFWGHAILVSLDTHLKPSSAEVAG